MRSFDDFLAVSVNNEQSNFRWREITWHRCDVTVMELVLLCFQAETVKLERKKSGMDSTRSPDYGTVEGGLPRKGSGSGVFIRRNRYGIKKSLQYPTCTACFSEYTTRRLKSWLFVVSRVHQRYHIYILAISRRYFLRIHVKKPKLELVISR